MDTYPITARSLGLYFKVDGNNLERAYKDHLSGFRNWEQASHAEDWVLHPKNIGKRLGIDETMLHKDLMTFLTNKEGHGKRHTLIAAVKGTKASDIINVLMQIPQEQREQVDLAARFREHVKIFVMNMDVAVDMRGRGILGQNVIVDKKL